MMFSDQDIRKAIAEGSLIVSPFAPSSIRPAGLTLHLGPQLLKPLPGKVVDIKNKVYPDYREITVTPDEPYMLDAGEFVLGHTYERITVGARLGFLIEGRSTLARLGMTVVQTAMLVYPGHTDRTVTLELANHGPNPILLYPKMKIARVALFELKSDSEEIYDQTGKYREQVSVGQPIFDNEFFPDDDP